MEKTNFNFSTAELGQRGDKLVITVTRDKDSFAGYGYGADTIDKLQNKTEVLKRFPSDDIYEGKQKLATNKKNKNRTTLELDICDLRNRAKLVYGEKSIEYGLFKFSKLNNIGDDDLVKYALHVVNTAEPRLSDLAKRMVTRESLDTILEGRKELDDAIDVQDEAVSERRAKSVERTQLANELYKLISELCEAGKSIWKSKNEAYYTDYVIYGSTKSLEEQTEDTNPEIEAEAENNNSN